MLVLNVEQTNRRESKMLQVKREYQEKRGKTWEITYTETDTARAYENLTYDLISKKNLNGCLWIRSIERVNMYDGTQKITVAYATGGRSVYTVKHSAARSACNVTALEDTGEEICGYQNSAK